MNKFNVPAAPELVVEINGGSLSLRVSTSGNIEAHLEDEDVEGSDVHFRQNGSRVDLRVDGESDLNLDVPACTAVKMATGDGDIDIISFDGAVEASTNDGSIDARGRFDRLHLTTDDGQIEVEALAGSRMASEWELHTGDGSITIRLPRDFAADLDAATGDGRIRIDLPLTSAKFDEHSVRGKLNGGGPLLTLHTDDGSIEIEPL
jgi:DUF4097 and DUF4098 domain-containing protein YvlB